MTHLVKHLILPAFLLTQTLRLEFCQTQQRMQRAIEVMREEEFRSRAAGKQVSRPPSSAAPCETGSWRPRWSFPSWVQMLRYVRSNTGHI